MIKMLIKKVIYGYKSSSEAYIKYLKNIGVEIGNNVYIFCPKDTNIDTNNPHLLKIGDNVKITGPTTILTHDYSTCVLNNLDKTIYGKQKNTIIGNNVFLGWGCTVLAGTKINDNVIVGAGAVASGNLEMNSVYVGNPIRKIMTIEDYRKKVKINQEKEAYEIYKEYYKKYNRNPQEDLFHEYFFLFKNDYDKLTEKQLKKLTEERISIDDFKLKEHKFDSYEEFISFCERKYINEKN